MPARPLARLLIATLCACMTFAAAAQTVSGTPSTVSKGDVSFIKRAAGEGAKQVQLGQLALENSGNKQVKQLAQRIVDHYSKADEDLSTLAHGKQVSLPTPSTETDAELAELRQKDGIKFDQAWAKLLVKKQQNAVAVFTAEKEQAQDPDVRNFADKALPMLREQLELAGSLQDELALGRARDSAMDGGAAPGDSTFDHVATPATAASAPSPESAPARAASMGAH